MMRNWDIGDILKSNKGRPSGDASEMAESLQALGYLATLCGHRRGELIAQGFTQTEAFDLVRLYHAAMLSTSIDEYDEL